MARFVTPAGVVIELGEAAAKAVGYEPAEKPEPAKRGRSKKADEQSTDEK